MEFMISRTSDWMNGKRPTEKAYKEGDCWYIKIKSLEELVELSKKEGGIIIDEDTLEIYDDYRE